MKNGVAPMKLSAVTPTFGRRVTLAFTSAPCAFSFLTSVRLSTLPEPYGAGSLLPVPGLRIHVRW